LLSGDDPTALAAISIGCRGVISVIANVFPREFSDMMRLGMQGKRDEAAALHYKLLDLHHWLYVEGNPVGIKEAMAHKGLCNAELRLPLVRMSEGNRSRLREEMQRIQ
jgi:4-hydroxy-tetrahydrodipicolinate synthase